MDKSSIPQLDTIYNMDCRELLAKLPNHYIDVVLTSPFYNTNKHAGKSRTLSNTISNPKFAPDVRYDCFVDNMTNAEYCEFTCNLFDLFDNVLKKNGVILYNLSYGANNTDGMLLAVADVIKNTNFTCCDVITWKKSTAQPISCSPNRLTRICEFIYVFCRKLELSTFNTNKTVSSKRADNGQLVYNTIYNYIEAANNDGPCALNYATYSSQLCQKLLQIYAKPHSVVLDPFMGSGTTAVACKRMHMHYIGSEISIDQVNYANNRIAETIVPKQLW